MEVPSGPQLPGRVSVPFWLWQQACQVGMGHPWVVARGGCVIAESRRALVPSPPLCPRTPHEDEGLAPSSLGWRCPGGSPLVVKSVRLASAWLLLSNSSFIVSGLAPSIAQCVAGTVPPSGRAVDGQVARVQEAVKGRET